MLQEATDVVAQERIYMPSVIICLDFQDIPSVWGWCRSYFPWPMGTLYDINIETDLGYQHFGTEYFIRRKATEGLI